MKLNRPIFKKHLPWWFYLVCFVWFIYISILWSIQYLLKEGTLYAGWVGSWADGAAHLTYSAKFAYGNIWSWEHPILASQKFTYPFFADAIIGLAAKITGASLFVSHQIFGFIFSLILIWCVYQFYFKFFKNRLGAVLGVNIFLLSGGLGFYIFLKDIYEKGFLNSIYPLAEYTQRSDYGLEWMNFISAQLIPQRALLLGLPIGLLILTFFWNLIDLKKEKIFSKKVFLIMGLLLGLLPFIHSHSFLVLTGYLGWTFLLTAQKIRLKWIYFLGPYAIVVAFWAVNILLPSTNQDTFITWTPGWMAVKHEKNWLLFWWWNWGLFIPVGLWSFFLLKKDLVIKVFPFIAVFILANLWLFQPYDWDNTKFFTWVHLVFSGVLGWYLSKLWSQSFFKKTLCLLVFIILIFSGTLQAIRLLQFEHTKVAMYSIEELNLVEKIKKQTDKNSLFLTSDKHHHPITNLTGRRVMMGYPGWLWTYGLDYQTVESDVFRMYEGGDRSKALLEQYGVDYVVFDLSLPQHLYENEAYFSKLYPVSFKTSSYTIYKVR